MRVPALTAIATLTFAANADKPHVLLVLVDDFGWNNVGYHRERLSQKYTDSEVNTPNIDNLVKTGIELNRHYTYNYCSPSRSSLQSGRLPVHVSVENTPPLSVNPNDPVSGFSGIPRNMTGIAEKMKQAGYRTHMTGKWDAGMATYEHTPMGRGYETFFGYYHHANDYWKQDLSPGSTVHLDACAKLGHDFVDLWNTDGPASDFNGTDYEEYMFTQNSLKIINQHDTSKPENPLFLFHAFHIVHTPLQIPEENERRFSFIKDQDRRKYAAMVEYMDHSLGEMVAALQRKGMWDNTLLILSSDNGGPIYGSYVSTTGLKRAFGAASNSYEVEHGPGGVHVKNAQRIKGDNLRGGKTSDWEGGIRVNAFVSGGYVPLKMRGTILDDPIHIADWYATLCAIADVDPFDEKGQAAGLPPVDSINHWPLLSGQTPLGSGARKELHISRKTLIQLETVEGKLHYWKLVTGGDGAIFDYVPEKYMTFDVHANGYGLTALRNTLTKGRNCEKGCLFDIYADPGEDNEVTKLYPEKVAEMMSRLTELNKNNFNPDRGQPTELGCRVAEKQYGGFYGPFYDMGFDDEHRASDVLPVVKPSDSTERAELNLMTAVFRS
uniref:Sulfatase N-terminal domain-containing protein n=1 Tax=Mucochytrium quahogii TaxID=96639 RepID=A0A7S2RQN2_9STRA|mmetsp:Transcript_35029/g.56043  ORF Transcript_35029/g.56043 Transcript_35029/m.56043 type:complete len:607 (+) Transcript_35029:1030-2850(+)